MDAEFQKFLMWAFQAMGGAFCTLLYVMYRDMKKQCDETRMDIINYKLHVAENFATMGDISAIQATTKEMFNAMFKKLDNMETNIRILSDNFRDRLDGKQDKI